MANSVSTKLSKKLTLFDVYAVSTGAMFSSGFFLLPGIAAMETGNSVYLAYLAAGFLILPSMLSVAELSTAMPKAGGAYYFLDRSLGPLMGTIGGLGSWVALIFKSAFALIGMGAYLALFFDIPILPLALGLTVAFGLINIFGAKETALLQRILVGALVAILMLFTFKGIHYVIWGTSPLPPLREGNFITNGFNGFLSTIGLVFVSYAGLTKVASIAEEVQNPSRVIPLGMALSLLTSTFIFAAGVYIMVSVLPSEELFSSLTPVADAGRKILDFLPGETGLFLVVIAAIAAFASTGNAGIMSASRYPLAMSRDGLMPESYGRLGRFGTPTTSILITTGLMAVILILFDVALVAKLASAFQLLLFSFINLAVIVMRESQIEAYQPGFKSPLYPFVQITGMVISLWLVIEMGLLAAGFTGTLIIFCIGWFFYYAQGNVERQGAIYHIYARLGKYRYKGLERELMAVFHQNQGDSLSYEELIARAQILQGVALPRQWNRLVEVVVDHLAPEVTSEREQMVEALSPLNANFAPLLDDMYIKYCPVTFCSRPELVVVKLDKPMELESGHQALLGKTFFFLLTPASRPLLHMRLIGHLSELAEVETFTSRWNEARTERELKRVLLTLLTDDRLHYLFVAPEGITADWGGKTLQELKLPRDCLIAVIDRKGEIIIPHGYTTLEWGDLVTILSHPEILEALGKQREGEVENSESE